MFIGKKGEAVSPSAFRADAKAGRLGERLVARGLISQEAISDILDCQRRWGCRFGEVLIASGAVTAMEMAETLADALGLAFVDLMADPVEASLCQAEHIDLYLHRLFLPWRKMGAATIIACADPDAHTRQTIARLYGPDARIVITSKFDILWTVEKLFRERLIDDAVYRLDRDEPQFSARQVVTPPQALVLGMAGFAAIGACAALPPGRGSGRPDRHEFALCGQSGAAADAVLVRPQQGTFRISCIARSYRRAR